MYFEIENTPEHIRKARDAAEFGLKETLKEQCPRLVLAPFNKTPKVVFDNVLIGTTCDRDLEIYNPMKQIQQITLGKSLPPGLEIQLPGEWLELEPETCYCLSLRWTPIQPTALREIIRFTNDSTGRFDVIVVLKSSMNIKSKSNQPKGLKISPGKIKKKVLKKSPVAIYKKKADIIYKTTKIMKTVNFHTTEIKNIRMSNKENLETIPNFSIDSYQDKCPFDSPTCSDINFNTSEVFSKARHLNLHDTYDKSYMANNAIPNIYQNVLKPSNKQFDSSTADLFDNLTFTPLKSMPAKTEKLDKGPKVIVSIQSDSDFEDSLNIKNKENETHSIISVTSAQPNKWLTINHETKFCSPQCTETPTVQNKKHPDTSSPKELNSPNFSINTDFSRISDLSFFPQKFSTEKKCFPKINNDTHDVIDDIKISSDTFTKESPITPFEPHLKHFPSEQRPPHFFLREQNNKICRQALFQKESIENRDLTTRKYQKENYENYFSKQNEYNPWENYYKMEAKSPPRSVTPPLQSIPEESCQFSDSHLLNKTDKQAGTFTIDRTFDKSNSRPSGSNNRSLWSKKTIRADEDLWKIPISYVKHSLKTKSSIRNKDSGCETSSYIHDSIKNTEQNLTVNQIGNIYSQSFTVDPFMSNAYFYDEKAVNTFEKEFKRWLNYILTPPADLESNVEQKIDVGKVWIENRNKEIPLAPTKEHVSSVYHNSHRLESVRRAARALLMSSDIVQVIKKLNAQIDKKLIAIRTDRNLHLDVGLQKIIMELLLSYNPLWLRIGLEAIYGLVIPLKSNSDIVGLTMFIIHRMFKNPYLKNRNAKSNAPNMLLPAYMDAIKKFTLKKFFTLVFFLDQAKEKKLISHDPCLFCRNAICKESREIIIRFTKELIAGIGDITKHLRPLGYVVYQKQSYLDEYKYAVHNIAVDIRDGVRLTKVMEIILMKKGLLNQLRTPAISRLQKIHNVQVALNALKEADFVIVGDITANDIANGHREKTLSLLWQLIHVFRAPLFEKASNIIQTWWRKKYAVIVEKRRQEQEIRQRMNDAASVIQCWWRRIQYNRLVLFKMQQITTATVVLQKYWRMWLCRTRFREMKSSVAVIKKWYRSVKLIREAKEAFHKLRREREELRRKSVIVLQSYVRRWLCVKRYKIQVKTITLVQSSIRCYLARTKYLRLKKYIIYIQMKFRSRQLMKQQMKKFNEQKRSATIIQSYYRMIKQYRSFQKMKNAVKTIEDHYIAFIKMREERMKYLELKKYAVIIQAQYRSKKCRAQFLKNRNLIIMVQSKFRAKRAMDKERKYYLEKRNAILLLQKYTRSYLCMKTTRHSYLKLRESTILLQRAFRSRLQAKAQRKSYIDLQLATVLLQKRYRSILLMRRERSEFLKIKNTAIIVQRRYRAQLKMRKCRENYVNHRKAAIVIQQKYRALIQMRKERAAYLRIKSSCVVIQNAYRAYVNGKHQRQMYVNMKTSAIKIQNWLRNCKKGKQIKDEYQQRKSSCAVIQRFYRSYIITKKQRQEYIRIRTATIRIQQYYRGYIEMKINRQRYIRIRSATVIIQRYYRSHLETQKVMHNYLRTKAAASFIANYYRRYKEASKIRQNYLELRKATQNIQKRYRSILVMRVHRLWYLKLRQSVIYVQNKYRALLKMRTERHMYLTLRSAVISVQLRYRANELMKTERTKYLSALTACISIQRQYRAYVEKKKLRYRYLKLKESAIIIQNRYRALLKMRIERNGYLETRAATIVIQRTYRARCQMISERQMYWRVREACLIIQRFYRAYKIGKKLRIEYEKRKKATVIIQTKYRMIQECRRVRNEFLKFRETTIFIQRRFRSNRLNRILRQNEAAAKIQRWYISLKKKTECRRTYLQIIKSVTKIQATFRMCVVRKRYVEMRNSTITIQKYYRSYRLMSIERSKYIRTKISIIKLQSHIRAYINRKRYLRVRNAVLTIQTAYRMKRYIDLINRRRREAAICIQKNVRRYLERSRYTDYRNRVIFIQKIWRGKLLTRLLRCEYLQKKYVITRLQAAIRGFLRRKIFQEKREKLMKQREQQKITWAASKIQALFRGNKVRMDIKDKRVTVLRQRWLNGGLISNQETVKERNEMALHVIRNMYDIETVINAFKALEYITSINPVMYHRNASSVVRRVYLYMSTTNRSISSVQLLTFAAGILVNLTRYKVTGPKIYERERIPLILKYLLRFSNTETLLFCIFATYLWLFAKYDDKRQDLTVFLNLPENHKIMMSIKGNIDRMKRKTNNSSKTMLHTSQPARFSLVTANHSLSSTNVSTCSSNSSYSLPFLEPDYNGLIRTNSPRYFEDANQAIICLFDTYNL